ncbi:MAG: hypothetical protein KF874_13425 [Rhizobiaceae bacterium]|nr:hypothetical protein [Rhizobiaceae bacterium]
MRLLGMFATAFAVSGLAVSVANAACEGTNGRGWGKGGGNGKFVMGATDKSCNISFPHFINDAKKTRTPANQVKFTTEPKNGKVNVVGKGLVYTPNPGFKGKDKFCTTNKSAKEKGTLRGCITIRVK